MLDAPRSQFDELNQLLGSIVSGTSLMDENDDLLAHFEAANQVVEDNVVHYVVTSSTVAYLHFTVKSLTTF